LKLLSISMKLAALFSGGKDSTYALYKLMKEGHEIKYLITIFSERQDSWMFHYPCIELTKLQAESMGIKHIMKKTSGEKEKELVDLKDVLNSVKDEVEGIVTGALYSEYQKSRIEKICNDLGLKCMSPLWHSDLEKMLKEEIRLGFEIIIIGVAAEGLDKSWLGKKIDLDTVGELKELNKKFGINIGAEGGEFETLVLGCPIFKKKIKILDSASVWDSKTNSGCLEIKEAVLVKKQ
jgi:diphthine-ammonia ligase